MINSDIQDILTYGKAGYKPRLQTSSSTTTQVIVVGCGGTGSRIIPLIAQHIANHNAEVVRSAQNRQYLKGQMRLCLVDMDHVEFKNLKRQNFFAFDVERNKAEVLGERFSSLLGLDIEVYNGKFEDAVSRWNGYGNSNYIIFDCTDNHAARKSIEAFPKSAIIISCGNEDTFGQVLISNTDYSQRRINSLFKGIGSIDRHIAAGRAVDLDLEWLPTLLDIYKGFKDTEKPSCTDMELQDDQSMPINSLVAQLAYNMFYCLVSGARFSYNMVKCNIDNQYSTNYISNIKNFQSLYYRAVFGVDDERARSVYTAMQRNLDSIHYMMYNDIQAKITEHGVYFLPFLKLYAENNYRCTGDQQVEVAAHIVRLEEELKQTLGV